MVELKRRHKKAKYINKIGKTNKQSLWLNRQFRNFSTKILLKTFLTYIIY